MNKPPYEPSYEPSYTARFLSALEYLWKRKVVLVSGTALAALAGLAYALLAPPVYQSRALIYPQDVAASSDKPAFGGFSGALNPMLGVSHLSRVEVLLNSRETARQVILRNRLIPVLFPGKWESAGQENSPSNLDNGIHKLQKMVSTRADVYRMTLEIRTLAGDAGLAHQITRAYLDVLNDRLKANVVGNAEANREFLEVQMARTVDPWSKEKIQELIIREMERAMLLNASAFEVLEAPEKPLLRESPKRKRILALSILLGFAASCLAVLSIRAFRGARSA